MSTRSSSVLWIAVPIVLVCLLFFPAMAQDAEQQDEKVETFRVDVDVVNLFFNVKDRRGALVTGLTRYDFEVLEEGQKQTIKYFTAESNQPLTLGLLVDTSVSQERVLETERDVAGAFLREVLRQKDLAFLITFDVQVELLQDFTPSARELRAGLDRARINSGGNVSSLPGLGGGPIPIGTPKGTLLYDALYLASREKLAREIGRKAMVILTDGADQGSRMRLEDAIEAAQKADAICYVLLIADRGFYGGQYYGEDEMKKLTRETGGQMFEVGDKPEKIKKAFDQIASELRHQYSIGYTSTNTKRDGSFRRVEIKTSRGRVQSRRGYYAAMQ